MITRGFRWLGCWLFVFLGVVTSGKADSPITVSSPAFAAGRPIPAVHALAVKNLSPELHLQDIPANARSLVLIVDDPDSPSGLWTHWLVWNLPANLKSIPEGKLPQGAIQGKNSFQRVRYDGPAPPEGTGIHRYFFRVYALDEILTLPEGSDRSALLAAMKGHVIGTGEIFGIYQYSPALPP